ncbi:MAG: P-II family nitrogen regulator [Wujia sp.]
MNLLTVIIKKAELVKEICKELAEQGVHGGTILDGAGMASVLETMDDLPIFGMLKSILADDDDEDTVKVMLFVMNDEEIERARKIIRDVVGLDEPNTGIMFALPVSFVEGLGA